MIDRCQEAVIREEGVERKDEHEPEFTAVTTTMSFRFDITEADSISAIQAIGSLAPSLPVEDVKRLPRHEGATIPACAT